MAYAQTSNPEDAIPEGPVTGRLRWWQPLRGGLELQQEFKVDPSGIPGMTVWKTIPTVTELSE